MTDKYNEHTHTHADPQPCVEHFMPHVLDQWSHRLPMLRHELVVLCAYLISLYVQRL